MFFELEKMSILRRKREKRKWEGEEKTKKKMSILRRWSKREGGRESV